MAARAGLVDLAGVDLAWRVVSFVGLGACLIAGAWAYGRFRGDITVHRRFGYEDYKTRLG